MRNIIAVATLAAVCAIIAACSPEVNPDKVPDQVLTLKTEDCLKANDRRLVCVDDHVGKSGKDELKADVIEVVEAL